jgi:hypothetical protein
MAEDRISTESVSVNVMETSPIVLRETEKVRLVFLPRVVEDPADPIGGCFVYQRKGKHDDWEDIRDVALTNLKSGEGYHLDLHAGEVTTLIEGLVDRQRLFERHGIVFGESEFVRRSNLPQVVQALLDSPSSELADALDELGEEDIVNLSHRVDVSKLDALLTEWRASIANSSEDFWQDLLGRNAWVFSQLTGSPVVLVEEKAYVGGKDISNTGGGQVDYLVRNALTDNLSFVEIKTPQAALLARKYRSSGSYALGDDVTGGVVQVSGYRATFEHEFALHRSRTSQVFRSDNARCFLVVGSAASLESDDQVRSFELFRNSLAGVHVLTFDEVEARLQGIRDALAE